MKTLASDRCFAEILQRLRTIRPESTGRWGRMSAHQMICHLSDSCRMALGHKQTSMASTVVRRTLVKWIALYVPLNWPTSIETRPEIDQQCGGTSPGNFATDVAALEVLLQQMTMPPADAPWPEHPIFGRMSHRAWMRWAYLHADHHLRQFGA